MKSAGPSPRGAGIPRAPRGDRRLPRLAVLGLLATLSATCATGFEPEESAGRRLPGTEDARCRGESVLGFSPEGRWLVYESRQGDALAPVFVFFDLARQERHPTTLSRGAADLSREGRGPTLPACWSGDPATAYFPGHGTWFAASPGEGGYELRPVAEPDCRPRGDETQPVGVEVSRVSGTELRIVSPEGTVLAEHSAGDVAADRIEAAHLRRSPTGRWLAYVVTEYRGSFVAPPRGYVSLAADGAAPPRFLAAPVFGPLEWAPSGELYGCTGRPDAPRPEPRIVRWNL